MTTKNSILKLTKQGKILVSDGAWGTFLYQKGLQPGTCPELWNLEHPEEVLDIARSYIEAGADIIETNSFGASIFKLASYGLEGRIYELNLKAAEISRKAAGNDKFVAGSIGPSGKLILMGEVDQEQLYDAFRQQAMALCDGGVDAIIIETMSDLEEAVAAVKACKENTDCEVIASMTFNKSGENSYHTMMGITPADMVDSLIVAGTDIIGANCGNGIRDMIEITTLIREANSSIPIMIQANAGIPVYKDGMTIFPETPGEMAGFVESLVQAGANIIGGCCGTGPEHIRQIANIIRQVRSVV